MIRTARLVLRRPRAGDAGVLIAALADRAIVRQLGSVPWPFSACDASDWLARAAGVPTMFAITLDDRLIGAAGIGPADEADGGLGYWLGRDHWGRGYASEAAMALVGHAASTGMRSLVAGHYLDNPASGRVLVKAGFVDTGRDVAHYSRARDAAVPARMYRWTAG